MRKEILTVKNLTKKFDGHVVLDEVSFSCREGEIIGFVGYNGCGKSVLFKCICGFLKADSGTVCLNLSNSAKEGNLGIIIEEPAFLKNKSGMKNLEFLYEIRNDPDRNHLKEVMNLIGLCPESKKHVGKYSLGMKQRLAIAQAIMEDPQFLILDEPMNGLDKKGIAQMRQLFQKLQKAGKGILLASHNREDISILCDKVYEIEGGRLREENQ